MGKYRIFFQIGATVIVLLVLYIIWPLPFRYISKTVIIPTVSAGSSVLAKITEPIVTLGKIRDLDDENKRLESENLQLKSEVASITEKKNKCQSQASEIESAGQTGLQVIQASVVGKSSFSLNQVFIINKGFDDGVREKTAVMSGGFLLGRVTEVSHNNATVKLVTSHDSLVPAMTVDSRQTGIVRGGLAGLVLTDIPVDAKVAESEAVVTSGMGGELAPGIPIGNISKIQEKSDGLFMDIKLKYSVISSKVEVVSVVVSDEQS